MGNYSKAPQYKLDEQEVINNYRYDFLHVKGYFDFAKEFVTSLQLESNPYKLRECTGLTLINMLFVLEYKYGVRIECRRNNFLLILKSLFRVSHEKETGLYKLSFNETSQKISSLDEPLKNVWLNQKDGGLGTTSFVIED